MMVPLITEIDVCLEVIY